MFVAHRCGHGLQIRAIGLVTGSVEVVATKVTDLTTLATGVYDLATDKEARSDAYKGLLKIKESIGNDATTFIPILADVLLSAFSGNTTQDWKSLKDSKTDEGKKSHLFTRGAENTVISAVAGVAFVKELPELAEKVAEKVGKTKKLIKKFVDNPFDELGKLKKNVRYRQGEFGYFSETDDFGRIDFAETENLQLSITERAKHNGNTPGKLEGDHAGHIFGDRFGGSPELDNLVSQASNVNLSKFKVLENKWAKALKNGEKVEVKMKINYTGNELRPSSFDVNYIIDGESFDINIPNN